MFNLETKIIEKAIVKSITIKQNYVNKDPEENLKDNNSRAMLNFGHTIGHALETFYGYKKLNHGEAISIGMIVESHISNKIGQLSDKDLNLIIDHFIKTKLKIKDSNLNNSKIYKILLNDKKNILIKLILYFLKKLVNLFLREIKLDLIKKITKSI